VTFGDLLRTTAQAIATLVEGLGVVIVAVAVALAAYRYGVGLVTGLRPFPPERLRLALGSSLALHHELRGKSWPLLGPWSLARTCRAVAGGPRAAVPRTDWRAAPPVCEPYAYGACRPAATGKDATVAEVGARICVRL
jgi:hypothetical protein